MHTRHHIRPLAAAAALTLTGVLIPVEQASARETPAAASTSWAWGDNRHGQLGDGTTTNSNVPVKLALPDGVRQLTGNIGSGYALLADGGVLSWGDNASGQLGNGTTTASATPVRVTGLTDVTAIAANGMTAMALRSDGTVWSWGSNPHGTLGNGTVGTDSSVPVRVSGLTEVTAIALGYWNGAALRSDGTLWTWGLNGDGQMGVPTPEAMSPVPVRVTGLGKVKAIAYGLATGYALQTDGTVWSWGENMYSQLGTPDVVGVATTPVQVRGLSGITAITSKGYTGYAIGAGGRLWAWGNNMDGEYGDGSVVERPAPVPVANLDRIVTVAATLGNGIALRSDGTVWCWGSNWLGHLGTGSSAEFSTVAVRVTALTGATMIGGGGQSGYAKASPSVVPSTPGAQTTPAGWSGATLPVTGPGLDVLIAAALAMVGAGVALLALHRRRARATFTA